MSGESPFRFSKITTISRLTISRLRPHAQLSVGRRAPNAVGKAGEGGWEAQPTGQVDQVVHSWRPAPKPWSRGDPEKDGLLARVAAMLPTFVELPT